MFAKVTFTIAFLFSLICFNSAYTQQVPPQKVRKMEPVKEASETAKLLEKELTLNNDQYKHVYDAYLGYFNDMKKLRKKFEDYDESEIVMTIENEKDRLREKLSPVLDTKQMDKWERFHEAMEERGRRMRETR